MKDSHKRVLVTGGARGIGLATIQKFLKARDFDVIAIDREFPASFVKDVEKVKFDLTNIRGIPALAKRIGTIDVLINNAGVMHALPFDNYPEEKADETIAVNIKAPVALIREFSKGMVKKGGGRIVNIASLAGQIGHPDVWYGVTKAGVINITKSFARTLGSQGVVVNAVAPGPAETDLLRKIPKERREMIKKSVYTGRFAKAEEIADTIYWLASESPEYINGFCVDITNGAFPR